MIDINLSQLISQAILKYGFRAARKGESHDAYRQALIKHVEQHDWAAAHELRVGKPQPFWSPEEVLLFQQIIQAHPRPTGNFSPGIHGFPVVEDLGPYPVTNEGLIKLATHGLEALMERRLAHPREDLPIFISVLLNNGHTKTTIADTDERFAVIKMFARQEPCFGYFAVMDMYIHHIDLGDSPKSGKTDAICANVGSRTLGLIMRRPYHFEADGSRAVFDPPLPDIDKVANRGPEQRDPYGDLFTEAVSGHS